MSNALSQSATDLAISNPAPTVKDTSSVPEWDDDQISMAVDRAMNRVAKGVTREAHLLNFNKVINSLRADFRSHFPAVYGRTDRIPSSIDDKFQAAVTAGIEKRLRAVNTDNALSMRRAFYHNANDMLVTERVTVVGENTLSLQDQHCGIVIMHEQAKKRLADLEARKTPDYDREKQVKAQIMKIEATKSFIEGEIEHQRKLSGASPAK